MELPGYEVQDVLGQGGFATVYRARQLAVGREVALKVDSRVLSTPRDRQRFLREVTAAGQLSGHPHVVPVYDAGVLADHRPYMVLELCPGGSLGDRLHRQGALPAKEARDIGVGLADAVAAAHAAGVLHRDIKPGNVMVNRYGGVALTDFGLAAMPRPGRELSVTREALTPAYAPPEAFHMADPSPAGDVYSLAATVYALLCGRPPHYPDDGTQLSLAELIVRHTWPYRDLPGLPPAFNSTLRYALAPDSAQRLCDAGAFRDALAAVDLDTIDLGGGGGFGPAPGMTTVPHHWDEPSTTMPLYRDAPPGGGGTTVVPGAGGPGGTGGTTVVPGAGGDGGRKGARRRPAVIAVLAAVAVSVSVSVTVVTYQNDDEDGGGRRLLRCRLAVHRRHGRGQGHLRVRGDHHDGELSRDGSRRCGRPVRRDPGVLERHRRHLRHRDGQPCRLPDQARVGDLRDRATAAGRRHEQRAGPDQAPGRQGTVLAEGDGRDDGPRRP
ncbi:serine/threonine-protein kinase [Streptomyces adelaidensis]|uniref:serine/threonine-protein kinase n=1 Tax=Streptomyces adelaidensis TaxID=2796465 RepID=UPI001F36391C|nr:serine/threonine-protein kinase [Streptomyces adelaidensis]